MKGKIHVQFDSDTYKRTIVGLYRSRTAKNPCNTSNTNFYHKTYGNIVTFHKNPPE